MTSKTRNQKILAEIKRITDEAVTSKSAARELLISEGIYTRKGKLRAEFGGGKKRANVAA